MTTSAQTKPARTPATEQVLGAALNLFTEQGYFNTSIPDIVKASSVSTGSIYHYFQDKEGIARSLYASLVDRMVSAPAAWLLGVALAGGSGTGGDRAAV